MPSICPGCDVAPGATLCAACLGSVDRIPNPCPRCGAPRERATQTCRACRGRGFPFLHHVRVDCYYRGLVESLVGDAKAGSRPAAGRVLEALLPRFSFSLDCIVTPIPPSRGRRPGPHLATALAKACARQNNLSFARLLTTTRAAAEQHRLTFAERRRNVAELFSIRRPGMVPRRVVLVDDLLTTGATASAAAATLRKAGAKQVDFVALARTPRPGAPLLGAPSTSWGL
jgi:predicted amidophosphoribosyltransferase